MAVYNVHAGHNWKVPGASGCFPETREDRVVKDKVIALLRQNGHTVYDCTDDAGTTSSQNLANIVRKCNAHSVSLDISIHFNAFNRSAHGTEVLQYSSGTQAVAQRIVNKIASLGFTNRGVKNGSGLYVLRNTKAPAILIECCFCDSQTDANIYNADKMAKAIVEGILNKSISGGSSSGGSSSSGEMYRVRKSWADEKSQIGAYRNLENAKNNCPAGYTVYNSAGKAVYSNAPVVENLYRVRKSWSDVKSQLGAYKSLDNAKQNCPSGYHVFDWNGKAVYSPAPPVSQDVNQYYRVRKSWEDAKSQLGAYRSLDNAKNNCPAGYKVFDWNGKVVYTGPSTSVPDPKPEEKPDQKPEEKPEQKPDEKPDSKPQDEDISPLKGISHEAFIEYIGAIAKADMKQSKLLASVVVAQAILESGWGQSELSLKANNLFGMKSKLSGNTWKSEWDGKIYAKRSKEELEDGTVVEVLSDFRAYGNPQASIVDHRNYLLGAKNGSNLRYEGLAGETDYKTAIQIIKDGGYATDSGYVEKICSLIELYDLDTFDSLSGPSELPKDDIAENVNIIVQLLSKLVDGVVSIFELLKNVFKH